MIVLDKLICQPLSFALGGYTDMVKRISRHNVARSENTTLTVPDGEFLDVKQAASILRLSEVSIRRFLTKGRLRRYKASGRTLVRKSDVLALIHEA
jgi:hypothetical protein